MSIKQALIQAEADFEALCKVSKNQSNIIKQQREEIEELRRAVKLAQALIDWPKF